MMQKIILFYKFVPLVNTEAICLWQKSLTHRLNLTGRVIIAEQGINGTLGGDIQDLKTYIKETKTLSAFKDIQFKWSDGKRSDFPRLSIKVKPELVSFKFDDQLEVTPDGIKNSGQHLKPEDLQQFVKTNKDTIFFDGRNLYEANIGHFKNAITPPARTSRDFKDILSSGDYDQYKNNPIVTYCTGGVRCEVLSAVMKRRGFKKVYQLDGGIVKYLERYPREGLWEGSLFVFDKRMSLKSDSNQKDIGRCVHCATRTSQYLNCALKKCNNLVLICEKCQSESSKLYDSVSCYQEALLASN